MRAGLVSSLNHPGGNITGISTMSLDLGEKWVGLLHELLPAAKRFAVLVNVENAEAARLLITGAQTAAFVIGMQTEIVFASSEHEIDDAFAGLGARSQGLIIHPEVLFLQIGGGWQRSRSARNYRRSMRFGIFQRPAG